jgi:hypothetical protein
MQSAAKTLPREDPHSHQKIQKMPKKNAKIGQKAKISQKAQIFQKSPKNKFAKILANLAFLENFGFLENILLRNFICIFLCFIDV